MRYVQVMRSPDDAHDPEAPTEEWRRDHDAFVKHCLATIPNLRAVPGANGYPVLRIDETAPDWEDPGYFVGEFFWSRPQANPVQTLAGHFSGNEPPSLAWVIQGYGPFNEAWKTTIDTLALAQVMLVVLPDLMPRAVRWGLSHNVLLMSTEVTYAWHDFEYIRSEGLDPAEALRRVRRGRVYCNAREIAVAMTALRWGILRVQPEAPSIELVVERSTSRWSADIGDRQ